MRLEHAGKTAALLAEGKNRDTIEFSQAVYDLDLSRADAEKMQLRWPKVVYGYDKRKKLEADLASCFAGGFKVVETSVNSSGDGFELYAARLSLRHQLSRMLSSGTAARGTFKLLERGPVAQPDNGGCCALHECVAVRQCAAECHAEWEKDPTRPLIEKWAVANGYCKAVLVPAPLRTAEDATNVTERLTCDCVHLRLDILAPHVVNNPHFVVLAGMVEKPPWKRNKCTDAQWQWGEEQYQRNVAACAGWVELSAWDGDGPLLLERIPGLDVQPPLGEKWLFVVSPMLCGVSGDLQGVWRICGLQQYKCPWCMTTDFGFGPAARRNDPSVMSLVSTAFGVLQSADAVKKRNATDYLGTLGFRKYYDLVAATTVIPSFAYIPAASWRMPHSGA
jgi:hypothetical protein